MSDENILKILALAAVGSPVEQPASDNWEILEGELGRSLPADYKQVVSALGSGHFGDLGLLNPLSSSRYTRFTYPGAIDYHRRISSVAMDAGIPLFPAVPGYLALGVTGVSRVLLVETPLPPRRGYRVCWLDTDLCQGRILRKTISQFLLDLYLGRMVPKWATKDRELIWGREGRFFESRPGFSATGNMEKLN